MPGAIYLKFGMMHSSQPVAFARSETNMQTSSAPHLPCNLMERISIAYTKCALRLTKCNGAPKLTIYSVFMFNSSFYM